MSMTKKEGGAKRPGVYLTYKARLSFLPSTTVPFPAFVDKTTEVDRPRYDIGERAGRRSYFAVFDYTEALRGALKLIYEGEGWPQSIVLVQPSGDERTISEELEQKAKRGGAARILVSRSEYARMNLAKKNTKRASRPGTRAVRSSGKVKATPIWAAQHMGKVRENQEDAFFVTPHLIGVFDGMGGHLYGEIASALARDVVKRAASEVESAEVPWRPGILAAAIRTADQAIRGASLRGGGTTAVVAALDPNGIIVVAHLGDSRAYQYRPGVGIRQITEDHGVGNILFRALTGKGDLPDAARHSLARGDLLILCSDGLSDELTAEQIQTVLDKNPKDPAKALVNAVLLTPARDNVTVVVYRQP